MRIRTAVQVLLAVVLWVAVAVVAVTGFSSLGVSSARATGRVDTAPTMRSALLHMVPPGSALDVAQRRMAGEGFRCRTLPAYPGQLLCERSDSAGWPVSRRWQVQVLFADGHVTDVQVDTGLVGP